MVLITVRADTEAEGPWALCPLPVQGPRSCTALLSGGWGRAFHSAEGTVGGWRGGSEASGWEPSVLARPAPSLAPRCPSAEPAPACACVRGTVSVGTPLKLEAGNVPGTDLRHAAAPVGHREWEPVSWHLVALPVWGQPLPVPKPVSQPSMSVLRSGEGCVALTPMGSQS